VVAGEVVDEGAVVEVISTLWRRLHLPRRGLVVGIADQRVIVRRVDLPHLREEELVEALPSRVQDAIAIPVEEAILDYRPMEEFATTEGDPMLSILVVVAQRDMVESLVGVVRRAGL